MRFFDGRQVRVFSNAECRFAYRESIFKRHKEWIIFSAKLELEPADRDELRRIADGILKVRNEKFPVTMQCAGSIFIGKLTDYGLVLMTHMAQNHDRLLHTARDLAVESRLPRPTVSKLLKELLHGWVTSFAPWHQGWVQSGQEAARNLGG